MGQTVYVDLLFMINFSMDFLCFFLCSKLFGVKLSLKRGILASAVGGAYSVFALFIVAGKMAAFLIDIAVCILICAVCFFRRSSARSLPLYILVYFAISMMLGGFMTAIFNLVNRLDLPLDSVESDGISVWMFALLAIISAGITVLGGGLFKKRAIQNNARVCVCYNGKKTVIDGMTDSGNLLKDPISGKSCIIVDTDSMSSVLPKNVFEAAKRGDIGAVRSFGAQDSKNVRLIPTSSATGEAMLIGLKVDEIKIDRGSGEKIVDAIVVLSDIKDSADGNKALIPQTIGI